MWQAQQYELSLNCSRKARADRKGKAVLIDKPRVKTQKDELDQIFIFRHFQFTDEDAGH